MEKKLKKISMLFTLILCVSLGRIVTVEANTSVSQIKNANASYKYKGNHYYSMVVDNAEWQTEKEETIKSGEFDWINAFASAISCNTDPIDKNQPSAIVKLDLGGQVITMLSSFFSGGNSGITDIKLKLQTKGNDHRLLLMYGTPIEQTYKGKKLWLTDILINAHAGEAAYFIWAKEDADKMIRKCFSGLKQGGFYNMHITYSNDLKNNPYKYSLVISNTGEMYAYPILHDGTKLEVYYTPKNGKSEYAFDATDLIKSEKLQVTDQIKKDIVNYINKNIVDKSSTSSIKLNRTSLTVYTSGKKSFKLKASVTGKNCKVIWDSSNPSIATVDTNGEVTIKKTGTVTITAKANGKTAVCRIRIVKPSIKLNKSMATINVPSKQFLQLTATVKGPKTNIVWKSSNPSIATVSTKGKVKAKKIGATTISAKANGVTAKCRIIVKKRDSATIAYEKFLKNNFKNCYYAIVNAGQNRKPILIVTTAFNYISYSKYIGYGIIVFEYKNGKVRKKFDFIPQSSSAGPWYYYKNKLYTLGRRGGYYRLDIVGDTYSRPFFDGYNKTIFKDANIVKLKCRLPA